MRTPQRMTRLTWLIFAVAACGGDGETPTIVPPTAASITIASATTGTLVSIGDTRALTASARDASQNVIANASVTWSTSNASVATVTGSGATATVTAVGNGSAAITATSGSVQASLAVDVAQRFATLVVTPATPSLAIGATAPLVVSARDARNAAIGGITGTTFSTSDRSKALVDATGIVTAIAPGAATVTASLTRDGITATANAAITVASPVAAAAQITVNATDGLAFTPATATVSVGGTVIYSFAGITHNVAFSAAGAPANIPNSANVSVNRVFGSAGTFDYQCTIHAGMRGSIIAANPSIFAQLNGANERPTPNNSTANGAALFTRNGDAVSYTVTYQGIASAPTGLHIHAPASSAVATGVIVDLVTTPLTTPSGVLTGTFTSTNIRSLGGQPPISMDSLFVLLAGSNAYVNVHSTAFPGGEIRGQTGRP